MTKRELELQEMTNQSQANGNSEMFVYIDETQHLHVGFNNGNCAVALLYRGETITRSECDITLLSRVVADYRKAYAHTEEEETQ